MKRVVVVVGLAFVILSLFGSANYASADTDINIWTPYNGVTPDDCTGDVVTYTGNIHSVIRTEITADRFYLKEMDNTADVKGVGATTLTTPPISYVINDTAHDLLNITETTFETRTYDHYRIVSAGAPPNLFLFVTLRIKVNGTNVAVSVDDSRMGCSG